MTTDNKTLADVQPGGMVRLGDGLPPLPKAGYVTGGDFGHEAHNAFTPEQMREYALAALSAQPSPGGQDALDCIGRIEEAIEFRVPHDIYAAVHGELAELKAALAARQPVGEAVARSIIEEFVQCADVGRPPGKLLAQARDYLAAPPAQAVDLGQFRRPIEEWRSDMEQWVEGHGDYDGVFAKDIAEANRLLALIDSQAVGNG